MKVNTNDYAGHVVAVNAMARDMQKKAARPDNTQAVYKIATDIMLECQRIREITNKPPKTLMDYIKRVLP